MPMRIAGLLRSSGLRSAVAALRGDERREGVVEHLSERVSGLASPLLIQIFDKLPVERVLDFRSTDFCISADFVGAKKVEREIKETFSRKMEYAISREDWGLVEKLITQNAEDAFNLLFPDKVDNEGFKKFFCEFYASFDKTELIGQCFIEDAFRIALNSRDAELIERLLKPNLDEDTLKIVFHNLDNDTLKRIFHKTDGDTLKVICPNPRLSQHFIGVRFFQTLNTHSLFCHSAFKEDKDEVILKILEVLIKNMTSENIRDNFKHYWFFISEKRDFFEGGLRLMCDNPAMDVSTLCNALEECLEKDRYKGWSQQQQILRNAVFQKYPDLYKEYYAKERGFKYFFSKK